MSSDLEVLKDIPGYKAILKSVLKSQIQLLIEQLSRHTGEETVILTACVRDGSLSHLGSTTGKGFLEGREEIKSQFLGYCLKTVNKTIIPDIRASPYQRPSLGNSSRRIRKKFQPIVFHRDGSDASLLGSVIKATETLPSQEIVTDIASSVKKTNDSSMEQSVVKLEVNEQSNYESPSDAKLNDLFPSGIHLSHTETSASEYPEANQCDNHQGNDSAGKESETDDSNAASIKIEPITENEMELEITGVDQGHKIRTESWIQSQGNQDAEQSGYSDSLLNLYELSTAHFHQQLLEESSLSEKRRLQQSYGSDILIGTQENTLLSDDIMQQKRKHQCSFCPRGFYSKSDLTRHLMTHTGEKPFKCDMCGAAFNRKHSLKVHQITHINRDMN